MPPKPFSPLATPSVSSRRTPPESASPQQRYLVGSLADPSRSYPMRRVVVTGLGMVTPLGCGVEPTWTRILAGASGAGPITSFDASDLPAQIACNIPRGDGSDGTFNPDDWMEPKEQRKVDDFIVFAMAAASQALEDA